LNIITAALPPAASVNPKVLTYRAAEAKYPRPTSKTSVTKGSATRVAECSHKKDKNEARELQKAQKKSRPVSSNPVPGTPW
jgi:hypothetical protein